MALPTVFPPAGGCKSSAIAVSGGYVGNGTMAQGLPCVSARMIMFEEYRSQRFCESSRQWLDLIRIIEVSRILRLPHLPHQPRVLYESLFEDWKATSLFIDIVELGDLGDLGGSRGSRLRVRPSPFPGNLESIRRRAVSDRTQHYHMLSHTIGGVVA